jgi:L-ribulose-5-phosphate 4-epimerase
MSDKIDIDALKQRLVEGIQVVTGEGILSGSGHLSVRIPGTETFLINPRFAGVLADAADICAVNFDGKRIAGAGPIPSESVIHSAIYKQRPDIASVLHCHARYSVLMGLQEGGLIPFNREARIFADGVPVFPESHGINSEALAARMVEALGPHHAIFLRGQRFAVDAVAFGKHRNAVGENARLENPYRAWPFLLYKHKVKSKAEIRAAIRTLDEGEHY